MTTDHYDIVIIGGGPVGMALTLTLRDAGISSLLLEARGLPEKVEDPRPLALSHGSYLILHRLGVWDKLPQKNTYSDHTHLESRQFWSNDPNARRCGCSHVRICGQLSRPVSFDAQKIGRIPSELYCWRNSYSTGYR